MIRWFLLTALTLLYPLAAEVHWDEEQPGGFGVKARISELTVTQRDQFEVNLTLEYPRTHSVDPNQLKKQLLSNSEFHLVEFKSSQPLTKGDWETVKLNFVLEAWIPGKHPLSFGGIRFQPKPPTANAVVIWSEVYPITVTLSEELQVESFAPAPPIPLSDKPQIGLTPENRRDLIDNPERQEEQSKLLEQSFESRQIPWRQIGLLLAIVSAAWAGYRLTRKWQRHASGKALKSPRERALAELAALSNEALPQKGMFERYYVRLTLIVRTFIEDEFGLHAPEQTTEEFLQAVEKDPAFEKQTQEKLGGFLSEADLVKFARHAPSVADTEKAQGAAQDFIAYQRNPED